MTIYNKKEGLLLFLGDIFVFVISLWMALSLRGLEIPPLKIFQIHLLPFSFVFATWIISFFVAGLYRKHTLLFKSRLPTLLLNTQIINSVLAIAFFYFIPSLVITPKVLLFIYLIVSFLNLTKSPTSSGRASTKYNSPALSCIRFLIKSSMFLKFCSRSGFVFPSLAKGVSVAKNNLFLKNLS